MFIAFVQDVGDGAGTLVGLSVALLCLQALLPYLDGPQSWPMVRALCVAGIASCGCCPSVQLLAAGGQSASTGAATAALLLSSHRAIGELSLHRAIPCIP